MMAHGTFSDGTETILAQTKVTFRGASPAAPIKEYIKNFYLKSNDSKINISLTDLFYSGKPLSVSLAELATTDHKHKRIIDFPTDMIQEGVVDKIVIIKFTLNNYVIVYNDYNN